jgi:hypothetical protein
LDINPPPKSSKKYLPYYDWVILVSGDMLPVNRSQPVEDFLDDTADVVLGPSCPGAHLRPDPLHLTNFPGGKAAWPLATPTMRSCLLITEFVMVKNTPVSFEFLDMYASLCFPAHQPNSCIGDMAALSGAAMRMFVPDSPLKTKAMHLFDHLEKGEWASTNVTFWGHQGPATKKLAYCVACWGEIYDVMKAQRYWGPGPTGGVLKLLGYGELLWDWFDFSAGKLGYGSHFLAHKQPGAPTTWGSHITDSYVNCEATDPLALDLNPEFYLPRDQEWTEDNKRAAKESGLWCWVDMDAASFLPE